MKMSSLILTIVGTSLLAGIPAGTASGQQPNPATPQARTILGKLDSPRGICAVLGDPRGELAVALAKASQLLVYVQLPAGKQADAMCRLADREGLLGKRIFVGQGSASHLHLANDLADAVVVGQGA